MSRASPRPPSLARRMVLGLVAFQALLGLLAILGEPLTRGDLPLRQWLATEQVSQLLAASIRRDATGPLVFSPTPAMTAYMEARPGFWFLGTDGTDFLRGGAAAGWPPPGSGAGPPRQGTTLMLRGPGVVPAVVLLGGQRGGLLEGLRAWLTHRLGHLLAILAAAGACTTALTIGLVHLLLRPVRRAAQAARGLRAGQAHPALPVAAMPAEILPLVEATNEAFARLEREHERQRRFIANAAHELRTPVAILKLRLDELPEGPVKARLHGDVRRLALLANQLLDLESLQHRAPGETHPVDLVALVREVLAEMTPLALDSGGRLGFHTARARWVVTGDETALRSVFRNLVHNALSHGGEGVEVEVRVEADGAIEVADHGIGVPAEARERVFEAFQRAGAGPGAGLGLHIVREVLRRHGATIRLRDGAPGAVFRILFREPAAS